MKKLIFTIFFFHFSISTVFSQSWKELDSLGNEYYKLENYDNALIYFEKALKQAGKEFGKNDSNYATSLHNLASIYDDLAQYEKAEPLYLESLKIRKKVLGEKNTLYVRTLNYLLILYFNMGKYEKVEPLNLEAIKIGKEFLGEKNQDYIESLINLAGFYRNMMHYDKAEQYYLEVMRIIKKYLGEKHPNYAVVLNGLAIVYNETTQYEKAEQYYLEAIKLKKAVLGENSSSYASSLFNLATLYREMGQYGKSEFLLKESLKIKKEIHGEKHPDYATILNELAGLYEDLGQYEKAESYYLETLKIYKELFSEKNINCANILNNLALLYNKEGEFKKSEQIRIEEMELTKEIVGEKHHYYAMSLVNLSFLYRYMGEYEKAEPLAIEAIKIFKEVFDEKHPNYAKSLINLSMIYKYMGQYDKAEILNLDAIKIFKEILGDKHPYYATSLSYLAELYVISENYEKAEPLFIEASNNIIFKLKNNFPLLSEKQRTDFLNSTYNTFDLFYSFADFRIKENPGISSNLLNVRLASKGIILSSLVQMNNKIKSFGDESITEKYNQFRTLRTSLIKAQELFFEERKKLQINLEELEYKTEEAEKELSKMVGIEMFKEINWKDIKNSLKSGEAAIEFIDFRYYNKRQTDTINYYALIIKTDVENPILVKLFTLEDVKEILSISSEDKKSYVKNPQVSNQLYTLIWKPLEIYLQDVSNIYISPSGVLNKISFSSLQSSADELLIDKYNIAYFGNLKDILIQENKPINQDEFTAVVFGGINYDLDSALIQQIALNHSRGEEEEWNPPAEMILIENPKTKVSKWNYLPGTLSEASNIMSVFEHRNFKVKYYFGNDATEEIIKNLSSKNAPEVLHISTHGYFFPEPQIKNRDLEINSFKIYENPLFRSGLIFAGANRVWTGGNEIEGVENGILTAYEVSNMDLQNTELIVLSACETGLGDIRGGEGVYGLQRAFKVAGAKTIIMSLWKVPDKETVELMELFYSNWLEKNMTKHEAFTNAQKEMRKKYPPYYWAAFVMVE